VWFTSAVAGCRSGGSGPPAVETAKSPLERITDPQIPPADSAELVAENAAFAFTAYRELAAANGNLVFSPASISIAMAMTYAGAANATATELAGALDFRLPPAQLHPAFNALDQALASRGQGFPGADDGPMRLRIVDSLWAERTWVFRPEFLDTLAANYGAGVNLLDFIHAAEASRQTINAWVAYQTENKIKDLLPMAAVAGDTRLVLTNAIYFNARWDAVFDAESTRTGSFTLLDGSSVAAEFMFGGFSDLPAVAGSSFTAVALPYADARLSLLLVVPDAGQFELVESSLDATTLMTLVASLTPMTVFLHLPRFHIETATSLVALFQALGMTSAFDVAAADFGGMTDLPLHISEVVHKAFIDVAEKGTVAAAATGVVMAYDGGGFTIDLSLLVDRPFLYFLRDEPTGAIVFMGRVLDPSR
jgi:serpin B